ncbi:hypothetical protein AM1_B0296 (plasmid) [Acaryochloris marina MBIC11017]|uniref:Uncharacterized protein n=1 Tax=Acaryochloris marina (strain MBIC 11017) TaxID=329726 RepID=A8ZLI8_ACAM1|nr:hypothetical protein AM1_B0296 [Acaryochloris marina MBIC11017]
MKMIGRIDLSTQTTFLKQVLGLIKVLFLGWTAQQNSQPQTYSQYSQSDGKQTQRIGTSCRPFILFGYSLTKTIRVLLPRLPTEDELLKTIHDSLIRAFAASSTVKVKTNKSAMPIGGVPDFRKAFKQISK